MHYDDNHLANGPLLYITEFNESILKVKAKLTTGPNTTGSICARLCCYIIVSSKNTNQYLKSLFKLFRKSIQIMNRVINLI